MLFRSSEVKLGVFRPGEKETLHFTIVRGDIPVKSVDAAYMLNDKFGYIKVNKFGETTYPELLISLAKLNQENCEGVIIDLRGNTGGYMGAAIQMVNEFLPKNRLIVYTQGRKSPRENYTSNGTGSSQKMPIVVLMDEGSASASEIFAGAIQDNDRGTIIGRRSFGKETPHIRPIAKQCITGFLTKRLFHASPVHFLSHIRTYSRRLF